MTSLTFYGGVNEIGGNKILVEEGKTRFFLDFGMSFGVAGKYFDEFLQPRKCNGILDLQEFGLLPDLKGIYREDYLEHCSLKTGPRTVDGVLLSHAHMDHSAYVHFLRKDMPIYCTSASKDVMEALDQTGSGSFIELVNFKESFKLGEAKKGGLKKLDSRHIEPVPRPIHEIDSKRFKVGDVEVEAVPVNHSLPGATAYIIYADCGPIVYTGDLRFHGYGRQFTEDFVKKAAKVKPKVLIIEGTRVDSNKIESEGKVKDDCKETVERTKGLIIVNFPVRDIDRMATFLEIAKESDRSLVINTKQAYLLQLLEESKVEAPRVDDKNIRVHLPKKTWGVLCDDRFPDEIKCQDYESWERGFLDHKNSVTYEEVGKNQGEYIFRCDFFELKNLIDIRPEKGSAYIRSVTEPFSDEMMIDARKADEWLKHFKLYPYLQAHCSGHANGLDLKRIVEEIGAETVIPVHTEKAGEFKEFGKVLEVECRKRYSV
ncbi:MAG: MBL fold metallo-hydrolase [Candidatus Altiarchaeota archaeon]|nr:MBL fold metallo-hydrolase [Candidatus Altiarchaeota archaeon]